MSKLGYKKMQRKQRCDTYGCRNLAELYIGKDKTNIYEWKRLCMECLGELARIWDEVKPQELPFADESVLLVPKGAEVEIDGKVYEIVGVAGVNEIPENAEILPNLDVNTPPSDQSKSEETDNASSEKTSIEGQNEEIPTNFMALKKFAKEKGMEVTSDTKKEGITAYLAEHGIG